jgi:uncharacterized protein YqeY
MSLLTKVQADIIYALKNKQELNAPLRLTVLRLLLSAVKNKQIDFGHELTDKEITVIIQQAIKQREESIVQYKKAQRDSLADGEAQEITILQSYLPEEISRDDLIIVAQEVISLKQKDQSYALLQGNAAFGVIIRETMVVLDQIPDKIYNKSQLSDIIRELLAK